MQVGVFMFKESGFISEHDALIGNHLANILCGGPLSQPAWPPTAPSGMNPSSGSKPV